MSGTQGDPYLKWIAIQKCSQLRARLLHKYDEAYAAMSLPAFFASIDTPTLRRIWVGCTVDQFELHSEAVRSLIVVRRRLYDTTGKE